MNRLRDGVLLAVGTLTPLRVPPPRRVDRGAAAVAMSLAPLAVLPLAGAVAALAWLGARAGLPPLVLAVVVVGALALGTRALHWDGLADTADGLTASYDRERALAVMRTGDVGPAGAVAVVVVAALQIAALATLLTHERGWLAAAILVACSRGALALACVRGLPAARTEGLGAAVVGAVPGWATALVLVGTGAAAVGAGALLDSAWTGVAALLALVVVVGALLARCVRRLGGLTGDVLGAAVELALAALLVAASTA